MKWLNSLDELLYEVMSWLLFFPLTLWRATLRPLQTMAEIDRQAVLPEDQQYASLLSPPLFLALTLLLAHSVATALGETDAIIADQHGLAGLVSDNASALALRAIVFAAFPLFLAARMVRMRRVRLDRTTLRQPFYAQCYPASVFALGITVGASLTVLPAPAARTAGALLVVVSVVHFWLVETRWLVEQLGLGWARAVCTALLGLLEGSAFLLCVGFLFTR